MKRIILFFICLGTLGILAEPVKVADSDILFLAHFNQSTTPEIRHGEEMDDKAVLTGGGLGYPFKSEGRNEALDVNGKGKYMSFPAGKNFDHHQGTLQMWLKPQWKTGTYGHCVFFKLIFDPAKRQGLEWSGVNTFYFQKPPKIQELLDTITIMTISIQKSFFFINILCLLIVTCYYSHTLTRT